MRVKLITLRYCPVLGGFDERPLIEATRDGTLCSLREHFYRVGGTPHLTVVLLLAPLPAEPDAPAPRRAQTDLLRELDDAGRALFDKLRIWRNQTARAEGVPPYILFNNRELAEIVLARPETPTALSHVNGIGPAKLERYGATILDLLRENP